MKRFVYMTICSLIILAGCSVQSKGFGKLEVGRGEKQLPPPGFKPINLEVVSIGDSLTQGVGDSKNLGGYIPYLKDHLETERFINNANFQNYGVKGNRTDQLLKRLQEASIKNSIEHADVVIITIGGNDVMKVFKENLTGLEVEKFFDAEGEYRTRINDILLTITSYNNDVDIILLGIYNPFIRWFSDLKEMDDIVNSWNEVSRDVVSEFPNGNFLPVDDIFRNREENLLYTDYFHPNDKGYELIGERIYEFMVEKKIHLSIKVL